LVTTGGADGGSGNRVRTFSTESPRPSDGTFKLFSREPAA
jgi:hypothetical protein